MSHPFGDLVRQHLSRKHGLSQFRLATGINEDPSVMSAMCHGQRLSGSKARARVVGIIRWLRSQGVLAHLQEANDLLAAAGMAGLHPDLPGEAALIESLQLGSTESRPGCAPPLPSLVVGRERNIQELKQRLGVAREGGPSAPASLVLTVVRGWPGVGKTTLARALAHDPKISAWFSDGLLWATLGPQPDLLRELVAWGNALGVPGISYDCTVEENSGQLAAFLRERRVLLIVDDVWEPQHAAPLTVGGRGCAVLITTRLPVVALALAPNAGDVYSLPVLTVLQGLELLERLAPQVVGRHREECRQLVAEVEGLPLAIQVAGRLLNLEAGFGWDVQQLLAELREGVRLLHERAPADMVDLAGETIPTVAVLLKKSTERLEPTVRDCFACLGAFVPEPATFDLEAMKAVWQVAEPRPIARELMERGLIEPVGSERFQMHALLRKLARMLLEE